MADEQDTIRHLIQRNEQQADARQQDWVQWQRERKQFETRIRRLEKLLDRKCREIEQLRKQGKASSPAEIWRQITEGS